MIFNQTKNFRYFSFSSVSYIGVLFSQITVQFRSGQPASGNVEHPQCSKGKF